MKPFAARLVDDLEVDVNVYPPGGGWGGDPGRNSHKVLHRVTMEALHDYLMCCPEVLIRQLEDKFGSLSGDIRALIEGASREQRRRWENQLLTAEDLDDFDFFESALGRESTAARGTEERSLPSERGLIQRLKDFFVRRTFGDAGS